MFTSTIIVFILKNSCITFCVTQLFLSVWYIPDPIGSEFYLGKDFANGIVEYQVGRMVHIGA